MSKHYISTCWEDLELQINSFYDGIICTVNMKRVGTLNNVRDLRSKAKCVEESIEQLKKGKLALETELKDNTVKDCQDKILKRMDEEIQTLQLQVPYPQNFMLISDQLQFDRALSSLTNVVPILKHYISMDIPKVTIEKISKCAMMYPRCISVEEPLDVVAIVDRGCKSIFLFTLSGKFINQFGDKHLKYPVAVKILSSQEIFVTDTRADSSIFKFRPAKGNFSNRMQLINSTAERFEYATGLDFDVSTNLIYLTLSTEHAIAVISHSLMLTDKFTPSVYFPQDIKVLGDQLFVLDFNNPCLHIISKSTHTNITSIICRGIGLPLKSAAFFCIDQDGNILLSDAISHNLQVYSPTGLLLHTLCRKGHSLGELFVPSGIHVTRNNDIIIASQNSNYPIQIF